jgi:hypothetical protein
LASSNVALHWDNAQSCRQTLLSLGTIMVREINDLPGHSANAYPRIRPPISPNA